MKLRNPENMIADGPPADIERWAWLGGAVALLVLAFFIVGPCCCPSLYEKCNMSCLKCGDDDSSDDEDARKA